MLLEKERRAVTEYCLMMLHRGITKGTGGNISIYNREEGLIAISPSGVEYTVMKPEDVVVVNPQGRVVDGALKPSSELGMHLAIYKARPGLSAVVHTHSTFATTIACANREIPAVHYLVGFSGTDTVPCIPYYPFGSQELANAAGEKFAEIPSLTALLLGNHGLITGGADIGYAFSAAEEIEFVAELYYRQLRLGGELHILSPEQMEVVYEKFARYGQK